MAWKFNAKSQNHIREQYKKMAESLSLELELPPSGMYGLKRENPTVHGKYNRRAVSLFSKSYGLDNLRQTDTCIRLQTRASKRMHFVISKRNLSGKLGQFGRHKEQKAGDEEFDSQFILRTRNNAKTIMPFFDSAICKQIREQLSSNTGFFTLEDSVLSYIEFGLIDTEEKRLHVETMLRCMSELAEVLEKYKV